jgi:VWFA-related protein
MEPSAARQKPSRRAHALAVWGVLLFLVFAVLAVGGDAQQGQQQQQQQQQQQPPPPTPGQQPPIFKTGINFVRVDVIVSDKQGNAVGNLQQADFDVTEDGKPQKIETFRLVTLDGGRMEAADGPPKAIRSDYDEEAEAARDDVRLFAIFFDDYHVRRGASLSVREPLSRFVERQLGPTDMVGLMYPLETTSSVRMTRNHEAIMKAVQQFIGRKFEYTPKNEFEEKYANYPAEIVEQIRNQVSLSAIRSLIVHMGTLKEGRKALILVSEGYTNMLPPQLRDPVASMPGYGNPNRFNPMAGVNDPNEDRAAFFSSVDMQNDLREIYDYANRYNVAIYAVDPRGLATNEFDINEGVNIQVDNQYLSSSMDTLRVLADNTDGRAIVNRNDLDVGMKQITKDSSAYYLIGYNSTQTPSDGKFHEIKVRVKRPGIQVRARKGYWALTAEETKTALAPPKPSLPKPLEHALATIEQPTRARVIRTWIGTSRADDGKTKVTFVWEPVAKAPGDRRTDEPARVSLMALGDNGTAYFRGRVPDVTLAATTPSVGANAAAAGTSGASAARAPSRVAFEAQPGKMQLRLSIEGASSQVLDSETREIAVPDLTAPQTSLGTPQVFRARTVRDYQQVKADADAVPVATREFSRTDRVLIRVPAYGPANTAATVTARLLNRGGQPMADLPVAAAPSKFDQQLDLPLASLAPGEYVVEIKASGEGGEAKELVGFRVTG